MIKYLGNENSSNKPSDTIPEDEDKCQWTTGGVRNGVRIIFLGWKARIFIFSMLTVLVSITEKVFLDTNS